MLNGQVDPQFRADVQKGLRGPRRAISARWLYDRRGSELFDEITRLPEYYPTRVETELLAKIGTELQEHIGTSGAVVEFGAGSVTKTPLLLRAVRPTAFVPIDISGDYLRAEAASLSGEFPDLLVSPVEADFTGAVALPAAIADMPKLGFFSGSTIGNFVPRSAVNLLRNMRQTLGEGAMLLIAFDRVKPLDLLIPAYDDAAGVTAAFNLNLLERINRELDGTIDISSFAHKAIWNDRESRIEMHLRAGRDMEFSAAGEDFAIKAGESIHTENSHKYDLRSARILLSAGGWTAKAEWSSDDDGFSLILAEAMPVYDAP
ncbi:L-histidine N(alpha)-methyltransferase [Sphingorhabdus arenilitoris]|uniref:L-histidine N(Alpha)-methyltransferase n=1 Tax=Sphingorhabdus arenilitoris TaxID=1490041 RepID=A0ABV8RI27_9SPHN